MTLSLEASLEKLQQALKELIISLEATSIAIKGLKNQIVPEANPTPEIQNKKGVLEIVNQNPFLTELK